MLLMFLNTKRYLQNLKKKDFPTQKDSITRQSYRNNLSATEKKTFLFTHKKNDHFGGVPFIPGKLAETLEGIDKRMAMLSGTLGQQW